MGRTSPPTPLSLGCLALSVLGVLAFWGCIAYLILHFVLKFW